MTDASLIAVPSAIAALALGAAVCLVACLLVVADRQLRRLPRGLLSVLLLSAAIATVSAQKANTNSLNGGSSSAPQGGMGIPPVHATLHVSPFTFNPPTGGFRLDGVTTNAGYSYAMPTNGEVRGTWHLRGAYDDVTRVGLDGLGGLGFPLGSEVVTSLWAHAWGLVRPHLASPTNEVAVVGAPMSAIPNVSCFWTAPTPSNTYLLTWQDFAPGRVPPSSVLDPASLVSAQLELRANGDFVARSNDVAYVCRRVNPDDWDGDGWLNGEDANPDVFDDGGFGPHQTLPEGANSNAYCWVDLVVSQADATVAFAGDGPSDLPDPRFVARAGATNRVMLLIGKTYTVTCDMPFACVGRSDVAIDVIQESETELVICWPVEIYAEEVQMRGGASFSMVVSPNWLGGHFAWTNCCCSLSTDGGIFTYSCRETCTCTGCSALGYYAYENYRLPANGGACECIGLPEGYVDVEGEDDGPYDAGASVSFSKHAIIFEDRYENTPGVWVERQSTRTELHCVAHGGPNGGHVRFEIVGEEKLDRVAGVRAFPVEQDVGPGMKLEFFITYRGLQPSDSANDIVVTSTFSENVQGAQTEESTATLTSVKVELTAVYDAPENHCSHRHVYGVGEKVTFDTTPSLSGVSMRVVKADTTDNVTSYDTFDGALEVVGSTSTYKCPAVGTTPNIAVSYLDAEHNPDLSIVEPRLVVTTNATGIGSFSLGDVVMGTLKTVNYIGPMDVSFQGVKVVELPCSNAIPPVGYFATTNYTGHHTHTVDAGAGVVHPIGEGNYWTVDDAGRSIPYVNWSAGQLAWKIPIGWKRMMYDGDDSPFADKPDYALYKGQGSRPLLIGNSEDAYTQIFTISSSGESSVQKFGYRLTRSRWSFSGEVIKIQ